VVIDNFTRLSSRDLLLLETLATVQPKGYSETEKVTPHRVIGLVDQEISNLRRTLKHVFSLEFFRDHIVPEDLEGDVAESWVHDAQIEVIEIIANTSTADLFALKE
jgi:hypothetical protein